MSHLETQGHHLQRTELEALRAENASIKADFADELSYRRDLVAAMTKDYCALRAEVERLTKERNEALADFRAKACWRDCPCETRKAEARVQKLEGALRTALHRMVRVKEKCAYDRYNVHEVNGALEESIELARAALESGTEPNKTYGGVAQKPTDTDPASGDTSEAREHLLSKQEDAGVPSGRPLLSAPAPKTFTEAQIAIAVTGAEYASRTTDIWRKEFFRILGGT